MKHWGIILKDVHIEKKNGKLNQWNTLYVKAASQKYDW
jgi:hypothetical protein